MHHSLPTRVIEAENGGKHPIWKFNNDLDNPIITPSIRAIYSIGFPGFPGKPMVCHSFVKNGKIQFLKDCTHKLAGQTVDMEDVDTGYFKEE